MNYRGKSISELSDMAKPLRELCKQGTVFSFGKPHLEVFEAIQIAAMEDTTLLYYDPDKPAVL